jgi:hypothetical protein
VENFSNSVVSGVLSNAWRIHEQQLGTAAVLDEKMLLEKATKEAVKTSDVCNSLPEFSTSL